MLWLSACTAQTPPNILLVVLDTVRADGVGGTFNEHPVTPELDRIAASGLNFEFAYATAPWTLPSHATLFTGLASSQHNAVHERFNLDLHHTTLAEHLSKRGYATYGITSNPWVTNGRGLAQGFDLFDAAYSNSEGAVDKGAERATELALGFVEAAADADRPFFLFVNYLEAHLPYAPPEVGCEVLGIERSSLVREDFTIEEAEEIIAGTRPASDEELSLARTLYSCEIAYQDRMLGRVFEGLRSHDLLDKTLVIVTADHGELLGAGGMMGHEFSLSDDVLRVPLIVRLPGTFDGGERISSPVSHLDIVPTVLDIVGGARTSDVLEGESLLSLVAGADPDRPLLAEYNEPKTLLDVYWASRHPDFDTSNFAVSLRSLRKGSRKIIANSQGEVGLFDLGDSAAFPENESTTKEMHAELDAWTKRLRIRADTETARE